MPAATATEFKQPSLTEFKRWCRDHRDLALTVCQAQAYAETMRKKVDAYIKPIFESYKFQYSAEITRGQHVGLIETPRDLYLCDDPRMDDYFAECDRVHRQHGFDGPEGHSPALIAETLLIEAQNALMEAGNPLLGLSDIPYDTENRERYLKLLLGACFAKQ